MRSGTGTTSKRAMADASRSEAPPGAARARRPRPPRLSPAGAWRRLNVEQRAAAVGAILLIVSTFGPFSFVEVAIIFTGGAVLFLLYKRADGKLFHVPFGDGAVIAAAGAWAGLLIVVRLFDRPLGQGLLALVCAAILMLAGLRERAKRPPDDLPPEAVQAPPPAPETRAPDTQETQKLPAKVLPIERPDQPPLFDDGPP
jgi:hypothetical protein